MSEGLVDPEAAWLALLAHRDAAKAVRQPEKEKPASDALSRWTLAAHNKFCAAWRHAQSFKSPAAVQEEYAIFLTSPDKTIVRKGMDALQLDVVAVLQAMNSPLSANFGELAKCLEALLVAALGHFAKSPRRRAVQLLNAFYSGVAWELLAPLTPVVTRVGQPFTVDEYVCVSSPRPEFLVLVSAPTAGTPTPVLTPHDPEVRVVGSAGDGNPNSVVYRVTLALAPFPAQGFYDWRVVVVGPGSPPDVAPAAVVPRTAMRSLGSGSVVRRRSAARGDSKAPCQGRFIVHRDSIVSDQMKEAVVDLQNIDVNEAAGEVLRHGTFKDVTASLDGLKEKGVTSLYLVGAFERDNGWGDGTEALAAEDAIVAAGTRGDGDSDGDSDGSTLSSDVDSIALEWGARLPGDAAAVDRRRLRTTAAATSSWEDFLRANAGVRGYAARPDANLHAVVCRTTPNRMLGGAADLGSLMAAARDRGLRVTVHFDPCVSATRAHRRYQPFLTHIMDDSGKLVVHPGTDGRVNQFEDQALLNYRAVAVWDLMAEEVVELVTRLGASSIYLSDAQSYPLILAPDTEELFRMDADGTPAHTPEDILGGGVVVANAEVGFWGTALCRTYPNPLFIKLVRALWAAAPDATLYGESCWGRDGALARSGVVPHSNDFLDAVASTMGRTVDKLGFVSPYSAPPDTTPIHKLRAYVKAGDRRMPAGAGILQVRSLCSARQPYPALVLGRTAWTAVDLLYCLPGVPMTFQDEEDGRAYRIDVTHTYVPDTAFLDARRKADLGGRKALDQRPRGLRTPSDRRRLMAHSSSGGALARSASDPYFSKLLARTLGTFAGDGLVAVPAGATQLRGVEAVPDYEGHVGVGGVVAAMVPTKPQPAPEVNTAVAGGEGGDAGNAGGITHALSSPALHQLLAGTGAGGNLLPVRSPLRMRGGEDVASPGAALDSPAWKESFYLSSDDEDTGFHYGSLDEAPPVEDAAGGLDGVWFDTDSDHPAPASRRPPGGAAAAAAEDAGGAASFPAPTEVRSWLAVQGLGVSGDGNNVQAIKMMQLKEARHRAAVGPQFGFDLNLIDSHYAHRQALRRRFDVLRVGRVVVLKAHHRFGEHGHVFAFARAHDDQVAVIACNFNDHASTFSVDCSPLADAFGANNRPAARSDAPFVFEEGGDGSPVPNFGSIWEVRDVFRSELRDEHELGPLIGFVTSDEAANAALPTTLPPHGSVCWLYRRTARVPNPDDDDDDDDASSPPPPTAEGLHWLLSSSIARLASSLQLKSGADGLRTLTELMASATTAGGPKPVPGGGAGGVSGGGRPSGPDRRWTPPSDVLRDSEIRANVRHNLVFSLLYRAVADVLGKRSTRRGRRRAETDDSSADLSSVGSSVATGTLDASLAHQHDALVALLRGALTVLAVHLRLTADGDTLVAESLSRLDARYGGGADERDTHSYSGDVVADIVGSARASLFFVVQDLKADSAAVLRALIVVATESEAVTPTDAAVRVLAKLILVNNKLGPVVFLTPELGKWSTVGGLGVMVDELTVGLAELGVDVTCISPFYHVDRKGRGDYLAPDGIKYTGRTVSVWVGDEQISLGVHEGCVKGVKLLFLHHSEVFPRPYPPHNAYSQLRVMSCFNKAALEVLCQLRRIPSVIVSNDWFTGLAPAFARHGHFGSVFDSTDFMHIAHNLDPSYEGRLYPEKYQGALSHLHGLPYSVLVDPNWADVVINPTRAALICSDTWATVSCSYREDLRNGSPLRSLLLMAPQPFAHPNGIPVAARKARLAKLDATTHLDAKAILQRKYMHMEHPDPSIPLFAFVGRITLQKGVHLILNAVDDLLRDFGGRAQFIVGGMASSSDDYGAACAHTMRELAGRHYGRFWADPSAFFTDGDLVNLGADFGMMPSMFEPGGIVQQEFHVAATPVIAMKTGGLKDTVIEYDTRTRRGNGLTFQAHTRDDFIMAVKRAVGIFHDPSHYSQLRSNAQASVMDLSRVSLAWLKEFFRLRRCLPLVDEGGDTGVNITFRYPVGENRCTPSSRVVLTGAFFDWNPTGRAMTFVPPLMTSPIKDPAVPPAAAPAAGAAAEPRVGMPGGWFETSLRLPVGSHEFKFIVDGRWVTTAHYEQQQAGFGAFNNLISVRVKGVDVPEWMRASPPPSA